MRVLKHAAAESCPLAGEALILPRLPAPRDAAARIPLGAPSPAQYDADADAALESSERYYLAYDERWRVVATYRDSDASPKEQFVFHSAGARGLGGSSYIDSRVLRDRDNTSCGGACDPWMQASDGTLEERRYYVQNWRADVVAIISDTNQLQEFIRYSPYGVPTSFPRGDYDLDGDVDAADTTALGNFIAGGSYGWNLDFNGDGNVDSTDTDEHAAYVTGYNKGFGGRTVLSRSGVRNRAGYAGYEFEPALPNSAWHVRHRVLVSELGRWNRRDPLGYIDPDSLLQYCTSHPVINRDSQGLWCGLDCVGCVASFLPVTWEIRALLEGISTVSDCATAVWCFKKQDRSADCVLAVTKCSTAIGLPNEALKALLGKVFGATDCVGCMACAIEYITKLRLNPSDYTSPPPGTFRDCADLEQRSLYACEFCRNIHAKANCVTEAKLAAIDCASGIGTAEALAPDLCHMFDSHGCHIPGWCIRARGSN